MKSCLVLPKACLGGRYVYAVCGTSGARWGPQQHSKRRVCLQTSNMMPRATHGGTAAVVGSGCEV
eukprot:4664390-Amphidinium_carterae.1